MDKPKASDEIPMTLKSKHFSQPFKLFLQMKKKKKKETKIKVERGMMIKRTSKTMMHMFSFSVLRLSKE